MTQNAIIESGKTTENQAVNLFDVGALFNLQISTWSGRKMLTRTDLVRLGYDPDNLNADLVNLGRKLMVPKAELAALTQIEQRARKVLSRFSVPFGVANAHFVPVKMLPTVEQQLTEMKKEFFKRVDSFILRFEDIKATIKDKYPDFWEKCLRQHYPANPSSLRKYYSFDWYIFKIDGISTLTHTTSDQLIDTVDKIQKETDRFAKEYVDTMRLETVKFCDFMTARVQGKPFGEEEAPRKLTARTIESFRNHINRFRQMNIFGDNEIEKMLKEFGSRYLNDDADPKVLKSDVVKNSVEAALAAIRHKAQEDGPKRVVVL